MIDRLVRPLDAEIDDFLQCRAVRALRKDVERRARCFGIATGAHLRIGQRIVLDQEPMRVLKVAILLVQLFQRTAPEILLYRIAPAEREDDWQGYFAFAEIVAD